jgi:hypothetical protein
VFSRKQEKAPKKNVEISIQDLLSTTLKRAFKNDPDLARRMLYVELGHPEEAAKSNPEYRHMLQVEFIITREAIEMILNNPIIKEKVVMAKARQLIQKTLSSDQNMATDISLVMAMIDELKQSALTQGIPISPQIDKLVNPSTVREALAKVETKLTPPAEVRVLADRDGQLEMLTLKQVRQLATQKRLKPVYQVSAKPQVTIDHSKPSVTTREESASFSKPVSLTEGGGSKPSPTGDAKIKLSSDLDVSPAEFVHQLRTEARSGVGDAGVLLHFLRSAKYADIEDNLKPYRDNRKLQALVKAIATDNGKLWIGQVIDLVKNDKQNNF